MPPPLVRLVFRVSGISFRRGQLGARHFQPHRVRKPHFLDNRLCRDSSVSLSCRPFRRHCRLCGRRHRLEHYAPCRILHAHSRIVFYSFFALASKRAHGLRRVVHDNHADFSTRRLARQRTHHTRACPFDKTRRIRTGCGHRRSTRPRHHLPAHHSADGKSPHCQHRAQRSGLYHERDDAFIPRTRHQRPGGKLGLSHQPRHFNSVKPAQLPVAALSRARASCCNARIQLFGRRSARLF